MSVKETSLKDKKEVDSVGIVTGPNVQDQRGALLSGSKDEFYNSLFHNYRKGRSA